MLPPLPLDCPPQTRLPPSCPQGLIACCVPAHTQGHLGPPFKHCLLRERERERELLQRKRNDALDPGSVYQDKHLEPHVRLTASNLPCTCCLPSLPHLAIQTASYC